MQLVLNDEVDRAQFGLQLVPATWLSCTVESCRVTSPDMTEERSGAAFPRHVGKFVDSCDHKSGQTTIDFLIDYDDREAVVAGERAIYLVTAEIEPLRVGRRRMQRECFLLQLVSAPRAAFQGRGRR